MPITALNQVQYKPPKEAATDWKTFRKGLNTLLRENELEASELANAQNLLLIGSGVPTKRWGSQNYFLSGATGSAQFVLPVVNTVTEEKQVLAFTDWGYLTKKNGASYTMLTGVSWPSGAVLNGTQLGGNVYIVSRERPITKYDFSTLVSFNTIAKPASGIATNISGASGFNAWSWRVTATGKSGGETEASDAVILTNLPQDLTQTFVRFQWSPVSTASGDLLNYNVYRGSPGDEVWIGGVDAGTTTFEDFGFPSPDQFRSVPLANSTGGPKAGLILRFQDRIILADIENYPTRILISGRYPQHERFDWYAGGGFIEIEPDSGEKITGLATYYQSSTQSQTIIVFKERSVWEVTLSYLQVGQYTILDPRYRLLTASQGCSSHRSIQSVENDIMFSNRRGVYILRYEPQLINVINANEISAKIKTFFEGLSDNDLTSANAAYIDKKYILSFPNAKKSIVFDRERLCFMGPWPTPFGINHWGRYVDEQGTERWIAADTTDPYVSEFAKTLTTDKGEIIRTILKTKREDFSYWSLFKTLNEMFFYFRAITGNIVINIYIEQRDGNVIAAKTLSISGSSILGTSGLGVDLMGDFLMGDTNDTPQDTLVDEIIKHQYIFKTARWFQVEIRTEEATSNYELLGIQAVAIPQARGNAPSAWRQ